VHRQALPAILHIHGRLNRDPLHLIQANIVASSIIEPGCSGRLVRRNLLRDLQTTAVLEIRGNSGCPEGVVSNLCINARRLRPPPDHAIGIPAFTGRPAKRRERRHRRDRREREDGLRSILNQSRIVAPSQGRCTGSSPVRAAKWPELVSSPHSLM
jgi:hypothetical protein